MKKGGGFGMVLLVVVLAIVLLLAARQWKAVAPTALEVHDGAVTMTPNVHGQAEAGEALQRGDLPGLGEMRQATDDHAQRVQDALEEIE